MQAADFLLPDMIHFGSHELIIVAVVRFSTCSGKLLSEETSMTVVKHESIEEPVGQAKHKNSI